MQTLSRCHRDRCIILRSRTGWRATSFIECSRNIRHWQFKPARKVRFVLRAVISRGGTIENLQVVSGHPLLVRAALEAVRQWRYRPYVLNGEPVEVETQVTVNFVLFRRIGRQQLAVWPLALTEPGITSTVAESKKLKS